MSFISYKTFGKVFQETKCPIFSGTQHTLVGAGFARPSVLSISDNLGRAETCLSEP